MGTTNPAGMVSVDLGALRAAAQRVDTVAGSLLDAVHDRLGGLRFDATTAGRAHAAAGAALRAEIERLALDLIGWARAAGDVAAGLRAGAAGADAAEAGAAAALR